jgi:hypothetical protein
MPEEDPPSIYPPKTGPTVNIGLEKDTDPESPWLFRFTAEEPKRAKVLEFEEGSRADDANHDS